jgi:membrane protein implicated in regulation of membrane protease activity
MKKVFGLMIAMMPPLAAPLYALAAADAAAPAGALPVDLTALLQAVFSLAASLVTAFLIPWLRRKYTAEERARIAALYNTIVYAAEQLYGAGRGEEKLAWAIAQLEAQGVTFDRPALEAEVKKMQDFGALLSEGGS